jgi:hypothetical protein
MSEKAQCYRCVYRGSVPGDCHSSCLYPGNRTGVFDLFEKENRDNAKKLNIRGNPHGVRMGWFMWPVNFDPVWLENCDGFEAKQQ